MNEFILHLESMLEVQAGTVQASTLLLDIPTWDSMAVVGFMALADGSYGKAISPAELQKCTRVSDLARLVGVS